jgi:hypothetical protein
MVDGPPPELSSIADCGLSADVGDPVGRVARFCVPGRSAAGLVGGADGSAGVDIALTALLKCMTGG